MKNKKRDKKAKKKIFNEKNQKSNLKDEYGYDFVAELSHFTNIDEQRENARKLEKL